MNVGQLAAIIFLAVAVILLLVFVIKNLASPKKIDSIMRLIKLGKISQAVKAAKAIIQKDPRNYLAHYYLGKAYLKDGKNELALMELKYVDQHGIFDNQLPEADFRAEIGSLFLKFNQPDEALKQYLLLTKLKPNVAEYYYNCAKIYDQKGNSSAALGFYDKTLKFDKRHVKAHSAMGLLLFRAKQITEAKKEIDIAIKLNPEDFSTYYYLGKILKETKDLPGAVKAFEKAQRDSEFRQKALIEAGSCYMLANSVDNAMNCYERAISAGGKEGNTQETLYARYFLAACFEKTHKIEKAIEQWEKIQAKNRAFRDVPAKLAEYKELQANDNLKEYLTSGETEFVETCKKACIKGFGFMPQQIDPKKWGCIIFATEAKQTDWRSVRKQLYALYFYRNSDPLEDTVVRTALDEVKSKNCSKGFICSSSGFTRAAVGAAENRPVELIGKEQLESVLDKIG